MVATHQSSFHQDQNKNLYYNTTVNKPKEDEYIEHQEDYENQIYRKENTGTKKRGPSIFSILLFLMLSASSYVAYVNQKNVKVKVDELYHLNEDVNALRRKLSINESDLEASWGNIQQMKDILTEAIANDHVDYDDDKHDVSTVLELTLKRNEQRMNRLFSLVQHVQDLQRMQLEKRYGAGPYQVDFIVVMNGERFTFAVQTASIHLMPHSIHAFMEMVEQKKLVGSAFVFNKHQPGRVTTFRKDPQKIKPTNIAFPEFAHEFPHFKATLGFDINPPDDNGSNNVFINIVDNSLTNRRLTEDKEQMYHHEMEPCFAKIVQGNDIINRITQRINENDLRLTILDVRFIRKNKKKPQPVYRMW